VSRGAGLLEGAEVIVEGAGLAPEMAEAVRYLGYPASAVPDARIVARLQEAWKRAASRARPRGIYHIYPVIAASAHRLELAPEAVFTGRIGEFLGEVDRVAVFVATAGPELVEMAQEAMRAGDMLGGLALDALGSALAEAMVQRLAQDLRGRLKPGEAATLPYSPGYCGIPLSDQRKLFHLVDASRVGVELLPSLVMRPLKSVSGLIGIGGAERVRALGNPCERCPLTNCRMRR